jgi:hypothetical protein
MTRKFTEVLEEYLGERDRQNGDHYDDRFIGARSQGREHLEDLAKELDEMVAGVKE